MTSLGHHAAPSAAAPAAGASVALDALIAAHRGPIIPCSPFAHPDLLFGSFRGRAEMVLRNAWGIPVLRRDGPDPRQGDLDRWRAFYLREGAPADHRAALALVADIVRLGESDALELDPWDLGAWLPHDLAAPHRAAARRALEHNGFLPGPGDTLAAASFVHARDHAVWRRRSVG